LIRLFLFSINTLTNWKWIFTNRQKYSVDFDIWKKVIHPINDGIVSFILYSYRNTEHRVLLRLFRGNSITNRNKNLLCHLETDIATSDMIAASKISSKALVVHSWDIGIRIYYASRCCLFVNWATWSLYKMNMNNVWI
jgi:hypothetical protein